MFKDDCEKAASIENALDVIAEVNPIFREASESAELGSVEKPLRELQARYTEVCSGAMDQQLRAEKKAD